MTAARDFRVDVDVERHHVRPIGELDAATVPLMVDSIGLLLHDATVVLDLSQVTFLDAAGLGAIVGLRNALIANGGALVLSAVHPRHARLFLIGGLAAIL
jgi:anti-sigma B factor antagonist